MIFREQISYIQEEIEKKETEYKCTYFNDNERKFAWETVKIDMNEE